MFIFNHFFVFFIILSISVVNASIFIETDQDGNTIIARHTLEAWFPISDLVYRDHYAHYQETPRHLALIPVRCPKGEHWDGSCLWECPYGENIWGGCLTRQQYCSAFQERYEAHEKQLQWLRRTIPSVIGGLPVAYPYEESPLKKVDPQLLDKWLQLFPFSFDEASSRNWEWVVYFRYPNEW
jgi:hypothetical protein